MERGSIRPESMHHVSSQLHVLRQPRSRTMQESRKVDVVAVHGLGGRKASWTAEKDSKEPVMWLKDLLPDYIDDPRVMVFDYSLGLDRGISTEVIQILSLALLRRIVKESSESGLSLILVGHNVGGLIIKRALINAVHLTEFSSIAARTSLLVFFSTPHRARDADSWDRICCRLIFASNQEWQGQMSDIIVQSSEMLKTSSQDFQSIQRIYNILNIYEKRTHPAETPPVFEKFSSTLEIPNENAIGRDAAHFRICQFSDKDDATFQHICEAIKDSSAPNPEYLDCIRALSDINDKNYIVSQPRNIFGTDTWLWNHESCQLWMKSLGQSLCLQGQSGSGVSSLTSLIAAKAAKEESESQSKPVVVIKFAFDPADDRYRSTYRMLASLSYQMLSLRPQMFEHVSLLHKAISHERNWRIDRLWALLRSLLSCSYHGSTVCVVNSPEECDPSRNEFLDDLLELPKVCSSKFQLIVGSADKEFRENMISIDLDDPATIAMRGEEYNQSLAIEMLRLQHKQPGLLSVWTAIIEKCQQYRSHILNGTATILTVELAFTVLSTKLAPSTRMSMKTAIESIPSDTNGIYHWSCSQVPASYRGMARKVLSLMTLAFRPLKLDELALACTLEPDQAEYCGLEDCIPRDIESDVKIMFGCLIRNIHDEFHLIHKSYRQWALHGETCGPDCLLSWSKQMDHNSIAQTCLRYLSSFPARGHLWGSSRRLGSNGGMRDRFKFWDYASHYWAAHYEDAERCEQLREALNYFFETGLDSWAEFYLAEQTKINTLPSKHPLVAAVVIGCNDLAEIIISKSDPTVEVQKMALEVAIQRGNEILVRSLLGSLDMYPETLHIAASYGRNQIVEVLLQNGADIMATNKEGLVALHFACSTGYLPMVETLLQHGSDIEVPVTKATKGTNGPKKGSRPLHLASQCGHTSVIDKLLQKGTDPNSVDNRGSTPLHLACEWQQSRAADLLLEWAMNVDATDENGMTPLHLASGSGSVEIVDSLLQAYSKKSRNDSGRTTVHELIRSTNFKGRTPLHCAAWNGHDGVMKKLLYYEREKQEAAAMPDSDGCVPLHLASKNGYPEVVQLLLEHDGAQIKTMNFFRSSPIHLAVVSGHIGVVKTLCEEHLKRNATLNIWDHTLATPLHLACRERHTRIARMLLDNKAEPNIADFDNNTPLHLATKKGSAVMVKLLLACGADIMSTNNDNSAPLHIAAQSGNLIVVKEILNFISTEAPVALKNRNGQTPIMLAAKMGHIRTLKELLYAGGKLNESDRRKRTLLHLAAANGHVSVINYLLVHRTGDVHAQDAEGNSPLHSAAKEGHFDIVLALLKEGANPRALNEATETPIELASNEPVVKALLKTYKELSNDEGFRLMHHSAKLGHVEVFSELVLLGIPPDVKDKEERTPLSYAALNGHIKLVEALLVKDTVDPNSRDTQGRTPLSYAAGKGAVDVIQLISEKLTLPEDVNNKDKAGRAPLWYASRAGNQDAVRSLLELGADRNDKDSEGCPALHAAASNGHTEVVKALISPENKDEKDDKNATSLYLAAFYGCTDTVTLLLKHNASTNQVGPDGWFPLHACYDNLDILHQLLEARADANAQTEFGQTALFFSTLFGHEKEVCVLLSHGANPLIPDNDGTTPFHIAAEKNVEILECILKHVPVGSADILDNAGMTPLLKAASNHNYAAVKKLVEREDVNVLQTDKNNHTVLWFAAGEDNVEVTRMMLDHIDLVASPESTNDLLCRAIELRSNEVLKMIWPKIPTSISHDIQIYEAAASGDNITLIELLLQRDVNQDWRDGHGWSLMDISAAYQERKDSRAYTTARAENSFCRPTELNPFDKSDRIELVGLEKLTARYSNTYDESASIRANHPIPLGKRFYFEATIINDGDERMIAIGFGTKSAALAKRPGMDPFGWGYHGEDGGVFHSPTQSLRCNNGVYCVGDIIGCCIDPDEGTAYFTRNGERLKAGFEGITGRLFPMIGLGCPNAEVRVNFKCDSDKAESIGINEAEREEEESALEFNFGESENEE